MWTNYAHSIPACTVRYFSRAVSTNLMQTEKLYITVRITEKCCRGICLPIPVFGILSVVFFRCWIWRILRWMPKYRKDCWIPIRRVDSCRNGLLRDIGDVWSGTIPLLWLRMQSWKISLRKRFRKHFMKRCWKRRTIVILRWNPPAGSAMNIITN